MMATGLRIAPGNSFMSAFGDAHIYNKPFGTSCRGRLSRPSKPLPKNVEILEV